MLPAHPNLLLTTRTSAATHYGHGAAQKHGTSDQGDKCSQPSAML